MQMQSGWLNGENIPAKVNLFIMIIILMIIIINKSQQGFCGFGRFVLTIMIFRANSAWQWRGEQCYIHPKIANQIPHTCGP
jgi:hypothetical protein